MKLPYREGDFIALPLGDGSFTRAQISACEHRLALLTVGDRTLRVSDDALLHHRWKCIARGKAPAKAVAENVYWMPSARAEREFAGSLGVAVPRHSARRVLEVRDDAIPDAIDEGITLSWSAPLKNLKRVGDLVAGTAGVHVRVQHDAAQQLSAMASWPLQRLTIAGVCGKNVTMENVRELTLLDIAPVAAFPGVTHLRVIRRDAFDARDLLAMPSLERFDASGVELQHASRFLNCPSLRTLRLTNVKGVEKARRLALPQLRTLALDHVGELTDLSVLNEVQRLEQLELGGFWQHDLRDMEWLLEMSRLKRVEIDVGGRRKNIELYRRAEWAYPWPL